MPAPTALKQPPAEAAPTDVPLPLPADNEDEDLLGNTAQLPDAETVQPTGANSSLDVQMEIDEEERPKFAAAKNVGPIARREMRKVSVPPHRLSFLKASWSRIYPPMVEHLKVATRFNTKSKAVEIRSSEKTEAGALQTAEDFIRAICLGFEVEDAIALLRLQDLYIETFEVKDVKNLTGDHLSRAIGRIAGKDGKTKFAIENTSRTRVVVAGQKIHILGGFKNIHIARESIVSLILGKQPGTVYNGLRTVAARMKERF